MKLILLLPAVFFAISYGSKANQTMLPCKKLCITSSDKHLEGFAIDSKHSPVYIHHPRCAVIYNMASCYFKAHTHKDVTECKPLCQPSSYKVITKHLRPGPRKFTIAEDCRFMSETCQQCNRQSYMAKYFESSQYEKEVDVGRCIGRCDGVDNSSHCLPVKNETISIPGPNGVTAVSVIKQCSCEASCYRFSYLEAFLERNDSNHPAVQEKVIDIGRCVGSCSNVVPRECLSRDIITKNCLIWLSPKRGLCRPSDGGTVNFINVDGKNQTIPVVKKCGCIRG